jgi:predicted nucleotidyltransferase
MNKIILKTKFGSHLYGTNTINSDLDYKSIYLPEIKDILVGKDDVYKSVNISNKIDKNNKSDKDVIEEESYTLQKYLNLLIEGQTVAIDMLFSNSNFWEISSDLWLELQNNRQKFITKKLKTFVYYCKNQANKYGFKGSRLNSANKFFKFLNSKNEFDKLINFENELKEYCDENISIGTSNGIKAITVCGKTFLYTTPIHYIMNSLRKFIENYGDRANLAAKNIGVDFKACSHFLRACYEIQELIETKDLKFPLKDCEFLKEIKEGRIEYKDLEKIMEKTLDDTLKIFINADLPEVADFDKDGFILKAYNF